MEDKPTIRLLEELEALRVCTGRGAELKRNLEVTQDIASMMLDNVVIGVSLISPRMEIVWLNKTFRKWFPHIDVFKKPLCYHSFYSPPREKVCDYCPVIKAFRTGEVCFSETGVCANGKIYDVTAVPVKNDTGKVCGVVETVEDITERKTTEKALQESEAKYRSLIENSLEGIGISKGNRVIFANKALLDIFGYKDLDEFLKVPLLDHVAPECRQMIKERMQKREKGEPLPPRYEYKIIRKDGTVRDLEIYTSEIILEGEKYVQSTFRDITERKAAETELKSLNQELLKSSKKLKALSLRDPHTGLYNHRYLGEIIEAEFHRAIRYAHPLSVIMLDIDYFKSINDTYGHQFGDLVLKQLAGLLKRMIRRYDAIIRFGGEEFVIISSGTDRSSALVLAQRILDSVNLYNFGNNKHTVKLKLSIAAVSYPEDSVFKGMGLIGMVEQILNKVKECGGNRVYSSLDIKKERPLESEEDKKSTEFRSLQEKIGKLTKQANQSLIEAIFAFAKAIEVKDRSTGAHGEKTVRYATETARALGLDSEEIEKIKEAAILHDLGKVGIREKILLKKTILTRKEFFEIRKHPQIGVDIIRPIQFLHSLIPLILYHHERWDGKGYPNGLKGEQIPIGARIVAIADVYQALISHRPYRKAYSRREAIKIIKDGSGTQFDPQVVNVFLTVVKQEE